MSFKLYVWSFRTKCCSVQFLNYCSYILDYLAPFHFHVSFAFAVLFITRLNYSSSRNLDVVNSMSHKENLLNHVAILSLQELVLFMSRSWQFLSYA